MNSVTAVINTKEPYPVIIGAGLLEECGSLISRGIKPCRAALVSDADVMGIYGARVVDSLTEAGFRVHDFVFPAGENSKNRQTLFDVLDFLAENGFDRSAVVIALGGGVTGDLAGFAAAIYMRGMKLVQMPTSLLAMVDSSVGGKTGVNMPQGKNLVGAFKQPQLVLCDAQTLRTLDDEQFSCGMAEVIKYAMICDEELFALLCEAKGRPALSEEMLIKIIAHCVEIKGRIVAKDEFDRGERQLLNFGHTIGHAIEKCSEYAINHGQAVGIGMAVMTEISEKLGICQSGTRERLIEVLSNFGLPYKTNIDAAAIYGAVLSDKKRGGDEITLILPKRAGDCFCKSFKLAELEALISLGLEG